MKILIDADAMPVVVREILFRAAERTKCNLILVSNQKINHPTSKIITSILVPQGPDEADNKIVELTTTNDLVISADIPLADRVISKGAYCIDPRGTILTKENIKERLAMRDLMQELRDGGIETAGPSAYSAKDRQNFANQLDRFLTKNVKEGKV